MPYKGTIKSLGKDYGFVDCPEIKALYNRDTFINKTLTGVQEYAALNVGEVITFDCSENPRGEPVAININGNPPAKGPMSKGGGKGSYKTFGSGEEFAAAAGKGPGYGAGEYGGGEYDAGKGNMAPMLTAPQIMYDPYEGKGGYQEKPASDSFPAWALGLNAAGKPNFLPEDAQKVTLYGSAGWFVSQTACEQFMASVSGGKGGGYTEAPQQVKRAAPDSWKGDGSWGKGDASYGKGDASYGKGDASYGKDSGYGKSDGSYGKSGKGDGKSGKGVKVPKLSDEPVANPGLEEGAQIYTGTVKQLTPAEGYGYVSDLTITQIYGKDALLQLLRCPWLKDMNLQTGESVAFNLDDQSPSEPQITRIVRLAI
jgi:cold shock CspA family protein